MEMDEVPDLEGSSCSICFDSNQFRVLQCGHAFCLECLQVIHQNNGGKIPCPMDRKEDAREPHTLPTPIQFQGQLFVSAVDDERYTSLNQLIDAQVRRRLQTINQLRRLASNLDCHEFNCAIAKITGSVAGVVGSVMAIVGLSLSLTGFGAFVGVPLAITGAGIGVAGGATTGVTIGIEAFLQKIGITEAENYLALDYFKSEQIKVLLMRASMNPQFAERWQIESSQFLTAGAILPRLAKLGVTTAAGVRVAFGMGRAATTAGLHVAGFVLAAAVIPLDLTQMIISSIRVHKKEPSKVIKDIMSIADKLEKQLRVFLIGEGYFQFIYTNDGHWMYVIIHAEKLTLFKDGLRNGFTVAQLKEFGDVVESGEGDVPDCKRKRIQHEWYSCYDELVAEALQEELQPTRE